MSVGMVDPQKLPSVLLNFFVNGDHLSRFNIVTVSAVFGICGAIELNNSIV